MSLTQIHGTFAATPPRQHEAWAFTVLAPALLRMAGLEEEARGLEANPSDERLWQMHFYGMPAVEVLARTLPGFTNVSGDGTYTAALTALRRLRYIDAYQGEIVYPEALRVGWLTSLLCGLRYHASMPEVVEMIHDYADGCGYSLPR